MDRRFAVIIGINDYQNKFPLDFCVNDAQEISKTLKANCLFRQEDVFLITSDKKNPLKDISGHFDSAIRKIANEFSPTKDSIFFYFAGHGEYHFENSGLEFHDSIVEISTIFKKINELDPKYQLYVIDACESGGKVLTRGKPNSLIENYLSKSSGILFMYATTENEKAKEYAKLKHGLFTHYFLEAIKSKDLYDIDGILTPNRIQDYVARETSKESRFSQTPVIENRTIGYYPFAFLKANADLKIKTAQIQSIRGDQDSEKTISSTYFPQVPLEIRKKTLEEIKLKLDNIYQPLIDSISEEFEIIKGNNASVFPNNIENNITNSIVEKSRNEGIESVYNLFSFEKEIVKPNPFLTSIIDAFLRKDQPEYQYISRINWEDEDLISFSLFLKSRSIFAPSCGFIIVVYQAIYGLGVASCSCYLEFTGYGETNIKGPFTNISAFKYNPEIVNNVILNISTEMESFRKKIENWTEKRKSTIEGFDKRSK
jgi:hypothetical protein